MRENCVTAADCSRNLLQALRCQGFQVLQNGLSADERNVALRAHSKDFPPRRFSSRPHPTAVLNIEVLGIVPHTCLLGCRARRL